MAELFEMQASDGVALFAHIDGPPGGPPLVLLHSIGCDHAMWEGQAAGLAGGRRVIRPDARGHGRSGAPHGDYTVERMGRDVVEILDALGIGRADVCGLSLGGLTAQWLAAHAPERVGRLVLASTAPRIGTPEAWRARAETVRSDGLAAIADLALGRFFSAAFRRDRPDMVEAVRATLLATSPEGYAGCCAALRDADLGAEVARILAPTLAIAGLEDVSTPPDSMRALAAAIPGALYVETATAHLSNLERPDEFTAALRRHLEDG